MNRFNAPEVLSALFKALEVAGLEDTIAKLKQMGVPHLINKAWKGRPKMALEKQAGYLSESMKRTLVRIYRSDIKLYGDPPRLHKAYGIRPSGIHPNIAAALWKGGWVDADGAVINGYPLNVKLTEKGAYTASETIAAMSRFVPEQRIAALYSLRLLMQYMEPLRPFVKNFRKFVLEIDGWMGEFAYQNPPAFLAPAVLKQKNDVLVGEEIPATLYSPPDAEELDISYPGVVRGTAVYKGTLAILSKKLLAYHLANVSDRKGFFLAFLDFFVSPNGKRFFLFLAEKLVEQVNDAEWWDGAVDEDWVGRQIEPRGEYISYESFSIDDVHQPDTKAIRNQRNYLIVVTAALVLSVQARLLKKKEVEQRYREDQGNDLIHDADRFAAKVASRYLHQRVK